MPEHAAAHFMLGRILLDTDGPQGEEHIRRAMSLDESAVAAGAALLRQYYVDRGDFSRAEEMESSAYEHAENMRAIAAERQHFGKHDTLAPAALAPEDIEHLRTMASRRERIARLWVARKVTILKPERPMLIVMAETKYWRVRGGTKKDQELAQEIVSAIDVSHLGDLLVVVPNGHTSWMVKKMHEVPDACVFAR
jgi:hypothetical protein